MSDDVTPVEPEEPAKGEPVENEEPLGEGGLKALKAEREARAAAEKREQEIAARLKEYEDRDKSEEQKAQEERDRLAKEIEALTAGKARAEVAAASSVPVEILSGPKSGSSEDVQAFADALIAWRGEAPRGPVIPGQGATPEVPVEAGGDWLRSALHA